MPEELNLLDPINAQSLIEFLEYEEALTSDKNTAKRIREFLIKIKIWDDGKQNQR